MSKTLLILEAIQRATETIVRQIKQTEVEIMSQTAKDVDAEEAKLAGLVTTALTQVLAAIAQLKANTAEEDLTPEVNSVIALEAPVQQLIDAANAVLNPPPAAPAS